MAELDVLADEDYQSLAVELVDKFVKQHGCPVLRTQISGLRQIASNEPENLGRFAAKQKERAEKRERQNDAEFWKLVLQLSGELEKKCENSVPQDLKAETYAPGAALSKDQQENRKRKRDSVDRWKQSWRSDHFAVFFLRFCAHYRYRAASHLEESHS